MSDIRNERINNLTVTGALSGGGVQSLAKAVAIQMSANPSGGTGIMIPNNVQYNFATGDFTLEWIGGIGDNTPLSNLQFFRKYDSNNPGYFFYMDTSGFLNFAFRRESGGSTLVTSSVRVPTGLTFLSVCVVVSRLPSPTVSFFVNGVQLGATMPGRSESVSWTEPVYICGTSGTRHKSNTISARAFNRALTAAEVLDLSINGVALADRGASQANVAGTWTNRASFLFDTLTTSGSDITSAISDGVGLSIAYLTALTTGVKYRITVSLTGTFTGVELAAGSASTLVSEVFNTFSADGNFSREFVGGGNNTYIGFRSPDGTACNFAATVTLTKIGLTSELLAGNAQSDTGQILDSSGNKNHGLLPASGATIVNANPARQRQLQSTNTWATSNALQYLPNNINREVVPSEAGIEYIDIVSDLAFSVNIGDGTTANKYASSFALSVGLNRVTLATNPFAGTTAATRKVTITPTTSVTAVLESTVVYHSTRTPE